jgi:D-glycero-D-manno-heptose 1,7-bisphosphate phosphatase
MHFTLHAPRAEHPAPAVFLDRDGTINVEKNYLHRVQDWEWIPGAQAAIKSLRDAGYLVVVVSNQAGIARGYYTSEDVIALHLHVQQELLALGTGMDAYCWCPHHPDFGSSCNCRKPAPGMFLQAAHDLNIDLAASWMVGDKVIDVQAGLAAGVNSLLVQTGYGAKDIYQVRADVPVFASLVEAVLHVQTHTPIAACSV